MRAHVSDPYRDRSVTWKHLTGKRCIMLFGRETLTQGSLAKGDIPEFVISLLANDMQLFSESSALLQSKPGMVCSSNCSPN